jgi:pyruvate/2-oxoglutarate dehydrogenase complex dihydrolipoamide acyltransferase (E2) component
MARQANNSESSAHSTHDPNGQLREKLDNKTEAVRRALDELGWDVKPLEIQEHVKKYYDVDITTKVISVYKGKLAKEGRRRGKRGRKPKAEAPAMPAPAPARVPPPRGGRRDTPIDVRDLRALKELNDRLGTSRLRELVELLAT